MQQPTAHQPRERLNGLQGLRFVAAMLVVWAHSIDLAGKLGLAVASASGHLQNLGAIGVDVFFVISGFIISKTLAGAPSAAKFWEARFLRVAPIYWLMSAPWMAMSIAEYGFHPGEAISTFLFWPATREAFTNPYLEIGWTLCFEMLFYGAMGLVLLGIRPVALLALFALALIANTIWDATALKFLGNPLIVEFLLGILIARLRITRGAWTALAAAGVLILLQIWIGYGKVSEAHLVQAGGEVAWQRVLLWGIPSALVVFSAVKLEYLMHGRLGRTLDLLGNASYAIYLSHMLVILAIQHFCADMTDGNAVVLLSLISSAIIGIATHLYVEKPLNKFSRFLMESFGQYTSRLRSTL